MPKQSVRQQARRAALDAQTKMRQARAETERRRSALAVTVVTALAERDALVLAYEARAGEALRTLTRAEGLSLREAVQWCGGDDQLSVREATRLRRVEAVQSQGPAEPPAPATQSEPESAVVPAAEDDENVGGGEGSGRAATG